jgi:type IV pilus assembly protein PilO
MSEISEKIKNAPFYYFLGAGLLLAGLYYSNFFDSGATLDADIQAAKTQNQQLATQISDVEKITANFDRYKEEINLMTEKFEVALTYLPSDENIYVIIKQMYNQARIAGVNLTSVKPSDKNFPKDFYEEIPIDIEVQGSYVQMISFFANIINLPRILSIRDVDLAAAAANSNDKKFTLRMKGQLVAYRYLEVKK